MILSIVKAILWLIFILCSIKMCIYLYRFIFKILMTPRDMTIIIIALIIDLSTGFMLIHRCDITYVFVFSTNNYSIILAILLIIMIILIYIKKNIYIERSIDVLLLNMSIISAQTSIIGMILLSLI